MMKKFEIVINEQLQKTVSIEAENYENAIQKVIRQYKNEDIILNSDNYLTTNIDIKYDENTISEYIALDNFKEYLNNELNSTLVNCSTEELLKLVFGNFENAIRSFQNHCAK